MKVQKLHNQGNHLLLDGYSEADLGSLDFIKEFLIETTKEIEMTAISEPLVLDHKADEKAESGITGTIILAESNITVHTYPAKKWFCLDIFSCKEFDIDKTLEYLIKKLKINKYKKRFILREA